MGLTDEERRRLDELADELTREDPYSSGPHRGSLRRLRRWEPALAVVLAVVSLPTAVLGVSLTQPLLSRPGLCR